jgi:hypothetical protein
MNPASRTWIKIAGGVLAISLAACLTPVGVAGSATAPRLVGSYQTSVRVLVDTSKPGLPNGYTAVRRWRFVRHCATTCTTTLFRPSIKPGSTRVFQYRLHVITGGGYRGRLNVPDVCYGRTTDGRPKILPLGSVVDIVVITIRPTRTSAGKVVAFSGTMVLRFRPSPWGHAEGCVPGGYQKSSVKSPA